MIDTASIAIVFFSLIKAYISARKVIVDEKYRQVNLRTSEASGQVTMNRPFTTIVRSNGLQAIAI